MQRTAQIVLMLALVAASARAEAQVTARQGTAPPPQEVHFASPMILDLTLPSVTAIGPGSELRRRGARLFVASSRLFRGQDVLVPEAGRGAEVPDLLVEDGGDQGAGVAPREQAPLADAAREQVHLVRIRVDRAQRVAALVSKVSDQLTTGGRIWRMNPRTTVVR